MAPPPTPYVLLSSSLIDALARERPILLPGAGEPGAWFHPSELHCAEQDFALLIPDQLWDYWERWDCALFRAEVRPEMPEFRYGWPAEALRMVYRVARWNPDDLRRFCIDYVEDACRVRHLPAPERERLEHAIGIARRKVDGLASPEDLHAAREDMQALSRSLAASSRAKQGSGPDFDRMRLADMARAAGLLLAPGTARTRAGAAARRAVEAAFQAGCRTPAGWIPAKILGRRREAELLAFLDVGTAAEREAVHEGIAPDGGWRPVRYILDMSTYTAIDASKLTDGDG